MRTAGLLALIMPLLPTIAGAADVGPPVEAGSKPDAAVVVPLELVPTSRASRYEMVELKNGKGQLPTLGGGTLNIEYRRNKLWVDSDADGRITDKDASVSATPNATVSARLRIAGREMTAHFAVPQASSSFAYMGLASALEGELGGVKFRLIPSNDSLNAGSLQYQYMQVANNGSFENASSWTFSKTADIGGKLYQLAPADRGWSLKATPYTGPVARVSINIEPPANACDLTLSSGEHGNTSNLSAGSVAACIPGDYRIQGVHLARNENGKHICTSGQQGEDQAKITLAAGDNELTIGGPFELTFEATFDGKTLTVTEVAAIGASGVRYDPPSGNTEGQLFAAYLRSDGREQEVAKLSYG